MAAEYVLLYCSNDWETLQAICLTFMGKEERDTFHSQSFICQMFYSSHIHFIQKISTLTYLYCINLPTHFPSTSTTLLAVCTAAPPHHPPFFGSLILLSEHDNPTAREV